MAEGNRRILTLQSASEIARKEAETHKADYETEVTRLQRDNAELQSVLGALKREVAAGKQKLFLGIETARKEAETLKADYDTKVTRLQCDKSGLRSALGALKREVAEGKQRLSLGIGDFKQWMHKSSVNADSLISAPDPSTSSTDIHQVLAHNALQKVHSRLWSSAYEDANKVIFHALIYVVMPTHPHDKSIVIRPSAMGYIAKALAQIGMGEPEKAIQVFDLAFRNCDPNESNLLLLTKVRNPLTWQVLHTTN